MSRKKILYIASRFPYPPIGGDKLKSYNLIKILHKKYDIHFVCINDHNIGTKELAFCNNYFSTFRIFKKNKYQSIVGVIKALFNGKPLQVGYYYFKDVDRYISEKSQEVDFLINTLVRTSEYVLRHNKTKYLDIVDSISLNYIRSTRNVSSIFWKLIYRIESKRLLKYEKKCIETYSNIFFVNKEESLYWSKYGNTAWIPNGANDSLFLYNKFNVKYENCVSFLGKIDYQPNIDAVLWFINNVFPKLNNKINFAIVGTNPSRSITSLKSERIIVTGFINDPYEIINSSFVAVAPMQTGGGIQNKILETMALGKITIATSLGAKPIEGARDNHEILIRDDPYKMAGTINDIFENRNKYDDIALRGQELIKQRYTWESYKDRLFNMLEANEDKVTISRTK